MNDEKFDSLEKSGLLIKCVSQIIKNEVKEQKVGFLGMLLGTLGTSLLGNLKVKEQLELVKKHFDASHPLTNFEIQNYLKNEPKFNVCSRNNLPKTKDGVYVINLNEFKSIGSHRIALYMNAENVTYFDSFGFEHIPKVRKFIRNKNITTNIYRVPAYDSIVCGYFCIMLKGKSLVDYTNLFSSNDYDKND